MEFLDRVEEKQRLDGFLCSEMKILFVCPTDPRETSYGGQQRTHVLWRGLRTVGDVRTVVPVPHKGQEERDEQNHIYKVCLERRYSIGWFFQRLASRLFPQVSLPLGLKAVLPRDIPIPDVCVARTLWVAARFGMWRMAPLFVDVDDTPTVDFSLANPHKRFKRWLLQKWQNWICAKAKVLWVPDPDQIEGLRPFRATHLPNIPIGEIAPVDRSKVDPNRLLFLGYLAHQPNIVAVDWFLENFWVELKRRFPSLVLDIIGGGLPTNYAAKWSSYRDAVVHGFVQDVVPFFERSLALITPMRIGSGTCIKVLESLARGVPVISTDQGLRGIFKSERTASNGIFSFCNISDLRKAIEDCAREQSGDCKAEFIANGFTQEVVNDILRSSFERDWADRELI